MSSLETIDILNQVLAIVCRSLPQYLRYSRPFLSNGDQSFVELIQGINSDQDAIAERIIRQIQNSGSIPDRGEFPMVFTDCHDLSIEYLIRQAIDFGKQDVTSLEECAQSLSLAPVAKSLTEEALGMTKGHLESLQEAINKDTA